MGCLESWVWGAAYIAVFYTALRFVIDIFITGRGIKRWLTRRKKPTK